MYKVHISHGAMEMLRNYVASYETYMIQPFFDTGMGYGVENVIRNRYNEQADELFLGMYDHSISRLSPDIVHGYKPNPEKIGENTLITNIYKRTLIIDYFEDSPNHTRTILSIRIFRD